MNPSSPLNPLFFQPHQTTGEQSAPPGPEPPPLFNSASPKLSFRDIVLGASGTASLPIQPSFDLKHDDVERVYDPLEPRITFKKRIMDLVCNSMKNTVIVKLLGRSVSYKALHDRLPSLWKTNGKLQIMDLENDYFQVQLSNDDDYWTAVTKGPWILFGHNLTVQPWTPSFHTDQAFPSMIITWIRIKAVPGALYKTPLIQEIGRMIGQMVKIDQHTLTATRGKFARLAVAIDITKSLKPRIWVSDKPYRIEYESLPLICFSCGKYGHLHKHCPTASVSTEVVKSITKEVGNSVTSSDQFGPWMAVPPRQKKETNEC